VETGLILSFLKLPKVNNRPIGENSPNLATQLVNNFDLFSPKLPPQEIHF
jgi:hypothetical protein